MREGPLHFLPIHSPQFLSHPLIFSPFPPPPSHPSLPHLSSFPPSHLSMQGHEALFTAEMKKYEGIQEDMQRNLEQQNKTLIDVEMGYKVRDTRRGEGREDM